MAQNFIRIGSLTCGKQFVFKPHQEVIHTRQLIRKTLLERISLKGVCRVFELSMPWLLEFIDSLIKELPEDLNAGVATEDDELEVILLESDELWSYVEAKTNPQWLWLIMHFKTRQVVAMQLGPRDKQMAEKLFYKLPERLKKKPSTDELSVYYETISNIGLSGKSLVRHATLKDLTARSDSGVQGL
jgi:IS1 family transposase